jgi:hypothetical protein
MQIIRFSFQKILNFLFFSSTYKNSTTQNNKKLSEFQLDVTQKYACIISFKFGLKASQVSTNQFLSQRYLKLMRKSQFLQNVKQKLTIYKFVHGLLRYTLEVFFSKLYDFYDI